MQAPKPGDVRIQSDGTPHGTRIEVWTDGGHWQSLRYITSVAATIARSVSVAVFYLAIMGGVRAVIDHRSKRP